MIDVSKVLKALTSVKANEPELIWTNPNPATGFASQTITIPNISDYSDFVIVLNRALDYTTFIRSHILNNDTYEWQIMCLIGTQTAYRGVKIATTGLLFSNGIRGTVASSSTLIPLKIYGIKASGGYNS